MAFVDKTKIFSTRGHRVSGRSRANIRLFSQNLRDAIGLSDDYFPIERMLDFLSDKGILHYEILDKSDMSKKVSGDHLAYTDPDRGLITLREDVYDGACNRNGQHRFTLAHEFGHLFLHRGQTTLARSFSTLPPIHKPYEDSEWQANQFAAELLMDARRVNKHQGPADIAALCGVSLEAANYRLEVLKKDNLLK